MYIYIYHVWTYDALKCLNICWYLRIPPARGDLRVGGQVVVREGVLGTVVGPSHSDAQHRVTVSFSHREDSSRNRLNCVVNEIKLQRALGLGWLGRRMAGRRRVNDGFFGVLWWVFEAGCEFFRPIFDQFETRNAKWAIWLVYWAFLPWDLHFTKWLSNKTSKYPQPYPRTE